MAVWVSGPLLTGKKQAIKHTFLRIKTVLINCGCFGNDSWFHKLSPSWPNTIGTYWIPSSILLHVNIHEPEAWVSNSIWLSVSFVIHIYWYIFIHSIYSEGNTNNPFQFLICAANDWGLVLTNFCQGAEGCSHRRSSRRRKQRRGVPWANRWFVCPNPLVQALPWEKKCSAESFYVGR